MTKKDKKILESIEMNPLNKLRIKAALRKDYTEEDIIPYLRRGLKQLYKDLCFSAKQNEIFIGWALSILGNSGYDSPPTYLVRDSLKESIEKEKKSEEDIRYKLSVLNELDLFAYLELLK